MITSNMDTYKRQAALAMDTMFYVAKEECFALKGGTAINFFIRRDLPRLSVDIDLDYILGFFSLQPKWDLIDIPNIQKLPAVQWKIKNLEKMSKEKFEENLRKTKEAL